MFKELMKLAHTRVPEQKWPTYDGGELDRDDFFTSSEAGRCLRWSFFSKHPEKYPSGGYSTNGYAERGKAIEAWVVDRLRLLEGTGYTFDYIGEDQRSFYDPDLGLSGTPDGLLSTPDDKFYLLEFKSIDPRFNMSNLPKKPHTIQTQQNILLVEKCLGITIEAGILLYFNASDIYDIREFLIEKDANAVQVIKERAELLWDTSDPNQLDPEGIHTGDCDYCPHTGHCSSVVDLQKALLKAGSAKSPFPSDLPSGGEAVLTPSEVAMYESYMKVYLEAKQWVKDKEELDADVRESLLKRNSTVVASGYTMTASVQPGRATVDKKLMEADGLDVGKYTKVGKPFSKLDIRPVKKSAS